MTRPFKTRLKKIAAWSFTAFLTLTGVLITVTIGWRPVFGAKARPLTNRQYARTAERLERGRYLVNGVSGCFDCHSTVPAELKPGQAPEFTNKGGGRVLVNEGKFVLAAPNITPDMETGAGTWSDDQFARAIREGIGHDGRTLFPIMPYSDFRNMSDEDLASVVVYIRSLEPVHNELPKPQIPFPLSRLIKSAPQPVHGQVLANDNDQLSRGLYLTKIGGCEYCHTPKDNSGHALNGMEFAGGSKFGGFPAASANLTPDPTGISYYDEALFIKTIRTGHVGARALNPPMPWWVFRNMSDNDLKAIFAYLRTVKPVHHRVDNTEESAQCKRCNQRHGGAEASHGGI